MDGWEEELWVVVWLVIAVVIGDLFAQRHFVLAGAALAAVVWGCIRWARASASRPRKRR